MNWKKHKLLLLSEAAARGHTAEIYDEIKEALGIPRVNMMFQVLASFPEFFDLFWRALKPVVETQEFFSFSNRLSAEAYTRMHNYFPVPDLQRKLKELEFSPGAQNELHQVAELYHYNYSILLLVNAALVQAFDNPGKPQGRGATPAYHPVFAAKPILVEEEAAPAPTRKIYDDIKRTMNTPFLNTSYLNFGRWPDFLQAYWESLKPLVRTPLYEQHRLAMRESALAFASELPEPLQLSAEQLEDAGVPERDVNTVIQLADLFLELLSKQILNTAFAKIGLEDGARTTLAA